MREIYCAAPVHVIEISGSWGGETFQGTLINGKGAFKNKGGYTYRGEVEDQKPHGLGVWKFPSSWRPTETRSGGWSAGKPHGFSVNHLANGSIDFQLCNHGNRVHFARVFADRRSWFYDGEACAPDDSRLIELKAAALQVEAHALQIAAEAEAEVEVRGCCAMSVLSIRQS